MNVFDMVRPHGSKPSIDLVDIDQSAVTPLASKPMVMQVLSSNFSTVAGCLSKERMYCRSGAAQSAAGTMFLNRQSTSLIGGTKVTRLFELAFRSFCGCRFPQIS